MNNQNLVMVCHNGVLVAKIQGDIDHHSARHIRDSIDSYIFEKKPNSVHLDLSLVEFMDSSGLGLILGRYNTACEIGAILKILSPSKGVKKVLELAGIERIIHIEGETKV